MSNKKIAKNTCSICGKEYRGYGNNARPYNKGWCCDECNAKYVIPYRIALRMKETKNESI